MGTVLSVYGGDVQMDINEVNEYLSLTASRGSRPGLERVSELIKLLGEPQKKPRVIHVAGTNGKGSVSAMLSRVLTLSGYRTGYYSSPALTDMKESFLINGEPISEERFCALIEKVKPFAESMADKPTQFEMLAMCAYQHFSDEDCNIAVIECGMGGELDATNVIDKPLLSVITGISTDHTQFLGDTTAEIAAHKAGIIKRGRPVVLGGCDKSAFEVIKKRADKLNAPLQTVSYETLRVLSCELGKTVIDYKGQEYTLSLSGTYQPRNAALVLEAIELLRAEGLMIPDEKLREGLSSVVWRGRFELLSREPVIIYDGGHNAEGLTETAESIKRYLGGKAVMLMGVMADKEYRLYPDILRGIAEYIVTVRPDNPRSLDPEILAEVFNAGGIPSDACEPLPEGLKTAVRLAEEKKLPLVIAGSLYMYREIIEALNKIKAED